MRHEAGEIVIRREDLNVNYSHTAHVSLAFSFFSFTLLHECRASFETPQTTGPLLEDSTVPMRRSGPPDSNVGQPIMSLNKGTLHNRRTKRTHGSSLYFRGVFDTPLSPLRRCQNVIKGFQTLQRHLTHTDFPKVC